MTEYKEWQEWSEVLKNMNYREKVNKLAFNVEKEKAERKLHQYSSTQNAAAKSENSIFPISIKRQPWAE